MFVLCVVRVCVIACVCDRVDLSMCNCVRRGIMLMIVCDVCLFVLRVCGCCVSVCLFDVLCYAFRRCCCQLSLLCCCVFCLFCVFLSYYYCYWHVSCVFMFSCLFSASSVYASSLFASCVCVRYVYVMCAWCCYPRSYSYQELSVFVIMYLFV